MCKGINRLKKVKELESIRLLGKIMEEHKASFFLIKCENDWD